MTKEEIDKQVRAAFDKFSITDAHRITRREGACTVWVDEYTDSDDLVREVSQAVRELVSQAYEEAAQLADIEAGKWDDANGSGPYGAETSRRFAARGEIYHDAAKRIRALKDSLSST